MRKILNLLPVGTLVVASSAPVIACGSDKNPKMSYTKIKTPQEVVADVVKDISNTHITNLPYGEWDYQINKQNQPMLKKDLQQENPKLTKDDLAYITIQGTSEQTIPMEGTGTPVQIAVKDGSALQTVPATYQVANTWKKANAGILDEAKVSYAPVKVGDYYYIGTLANGLWYSTDGLTNWQQVTTTATSEAKTNFDQARISRKPEKIGTNYFVATSKGLWYSANGTSGWQNALGIAGESGFNSVDLVSPPLEYNNKYYIGSNGNNNLGGIWDSANGASGWTQEKANNNIPVTKQIQAPLTHLVKGGGVPGNAEYFAEAANGGIYQSKNLTDWSMQVPTIHNYRAVAPPTEIFAPSHYGVGEIWYMPTTNAGLWTSADGGRSWQQYGSPSIDPGAAELANSSLVSAPVKIGDYLYAATTNHGLWRGRGQYGPSYYNNWTKVSDIPNNANLTSPPFNFKTTQKPLYMQSSNGHGLWTSTDGLHWQQNKTTNLTNANLANKPVKIGDNYIVASDYINPGLWTIKPTLS